MKLSIIICVYNTEPAYLRAALQSIADSTLTDYEICLVDDGSSLDYTALAAEYKARLYKTENKGILHARLEGIAMAQGDYLAFFDSDDTVSINYHQPMLEKAEKEQADIVVNDWAFHTAHTRYACRKDSTICGEIVATGDEVLRTFAAQAGREQAFFVTWNKIYRRDILKGAREAILKSSLADARVCYAEDVLFNFYAFRDAKRLCNVHTGYYFYRIHATQSINVVSEERLRSQIVSMGDVLTLMMASIGENAYREEIMRGLRAWQELMSRTHYSHAISQKYTSLYPLIQKTYGVDQLVKSKWKDSAIYYKATLLPVNFEEIDTVLRPLFDQKETVLVAYDRRDRYVCRTLNYLANKGVDVRFSKEADLLIPKGRIRPRDRFLHNDLVYAVGVLLFQKGSRLRALLKRIL